MIANTGGRTCVVCGRYIDPLEPGPGDPKHYHVACAAKAAGVAIVWHFTALSATDEHLSWVRDDKERALYLGVSFDDDRGYFTAAIVIHNVEAEGEGSTALDALNDAYEDLKQEILRITAAVWQLGQNS